MARLRRFPNLRAIAVALGISCPGAVEAASPLAEVIKSSESGRPDVGAIAAMYDDAILDDAGIERVLRRLEVFAGGSNRGPRQRANIHLVLAHVHWRHGNRAAAMNAVEAALGAHETTDGLLLKARLLDVAGDADAAVPFYERALAVTGQEDEAEFIRIRLTMAQARARNVDALVDLAGGRDQAFRNRAAIALAILGHPNLASGIYRVAGEGSQTYREHVRLAQWALASGEHSVAQREAWRAFETAGLQIDARYALALLVESHREEDRLAALIEDLDVRKTAVWKDDLDELRVDLLIETQQYGAAIAFYEAGAANDTTVSVAARRRLIELYDAAGRTDDMVGEYRRLMAAEGDVVDWFAGLASHYVGLGRRDEALAVWDAFDVDRSQDMVAVGELMIGMGFVEEAVAMAEQQMARSGVHVPGLLFLFDARLERGLNEDALAILKRLQSLLPPGDGAVLDLANAYERLNRPELAIAVLETLGTLDEGLGYNERMRLAWLYSLADRKRDALEAWRGLWVEVDSAARRSVAEDQFLLLAAELNTLADIVVELEEKIYAGQADRNEMDLLVRIYTEVGDTLSATEVVEEFSRSGHVDGVERLGRLANVHRLQNDYAAYDAALRLLIRKDPDNEVEHVRNLVLNLLAHDLAEDSDERYGEIQRWLGRLRVLDAAGVSGEFEAGVLSLGGFDVEAIESYRRALVANPDNSDNLLLMAEGMKSSGRRDEAVTMLQYAAEHAVDNNAFVVAVDGIINMIGARSFGVRLTPELRGTFEWTQRVILERITGHDDQFYLYQLLADIAQETADTDGVYLALENSLPQAGLRLPATLRELVTLATPSTGFAGFNTGRGDPGRQLVYGRRLVGLGQALPPDVYIGLGKVLLERDDVAGAEKAFDRIDDITGMIDVDRTKADLLYDAGYPERALGHYGRALSVNRDNLGLLARNALLHEVKGHRNAANEMYLRALGNLLRGEKLTRSGRRTTNTRSAAIGFPGRPALGVSRDYRTYFEFLAQGLLGTWPHARDAARERIDAVEGMFDEALHAVRDTGAVEGRTVDEFPRLDLTAGLVRRVADTVGDRDLAERIELKLKESLPKDDRGPVASPVPEPSALLRHLRRARSRGSFDDAVQLARLVGDQETLVEVIRDRIADGKYADGLVNAWLLLDEFGFRRLVTPVTATLKDNANAFLAFLGGSSHLVPAMEETLGREFISVVDLIELINQPDEAESRVSLRGPGVFRGVWRYVKNKGTLDEQIGFLAGVAGRDQRDQIRPPDVALVVSDLLSTELDDEQRIALTDAATVYLGKHPISSSYAVVALMQFLLLDIHPGNAEVVYAMAEHIAGRSSTEIDLVAAMKDIYEGSAQRGFQGIVELSKANLWRSGMEYAANMRHRFDDERARVVAAVERGEAVPPETAGLAHELTFPGFGPTPRKQLERQAVLAPKFAALDPKGDRYAFGGISALLSLGKWSAAEQALRDFYRENPEDEYARAALYYRLLGEGKFAEALGVVTDGGVDLRDQTVVDALLDKMSRTAGSSTMLFRRFYRGPQPMNTYPRYPAVVQRNIDRLREAALGQDSATSSTDSRSADAVSISSKPSKPEVEGTGESLRAVWRGITAPGDDENRRYYAASPGRLLTVPLAEESRISWSVGPSAWFGPISGLLASNSGTPDRRLLFDVLAERPDVAQELERFVPSLPGHERRNQPRLYELLADALDAAGASAVRLADLSSRLRGGEIGNHDFALWMTLRHRGEKSLSAAELDAFATRAADMDDATPTELWSVARLLGKAGAHTDSAEHFSLLVADVLGSRRPRLDAGTMMISGMAVRMVSSGVRRYAGPGLAEILAETADLMPPRIAEDFARRVLAVARPFGDDEASNALFDAFVLKTLANIAPPAAVLVDATRISSTATVIQMPLDWWQVPKVLELARLNAMAGNTVDALRLIRRFAIAEGSNTEFEADWFDEEKSRHAGMANSLARTFGLELPGGYGPASGASWLVHGRERVFPADPDHVWPGAADWMLAATAAMRDWLDDEEVDQPSVREMLFVMAWQLYRADRHDSARETLAVLAAELAAETDPDPLEIRSLALMSLRLESPLPVDLAVAAASTGTMTARQELELVRGLAEEDAAGALRTGRAADRGDKLDLLKELHPLAVAANDVAYAADLAKRIDAAEQAYRELGSPQIPAP